MKTVSAQAEAISHAGIPEVAHLLRAVDAYPRWAGEVVREAIVLARDEAGQPLRVEATLRVQLGPLPLDLELTLAISSERAESVTLTRLPNDPGDEERFVAVWRLDEGPARRTRIGLSIEASIDVPRLVPLGDLGDKLARRLADAAAAAADAASPPR